VRHKCRVSHTGLGGGLSPRRGCRSMLGSVRGQAAVSASFLILWGFVEMLSSVDGRRVELGYGGSPRPLLGTKIKLASRGGLLKERG
jgi:hypothetical protein